MSQETPKEEIRIVEDKRGSSEKEPLKVEIKVIESNHFSRLPEPEEHEIQPKSALPVDISPLEKA